MNAQQVKERRCEVEEPRQEPPRVAPVVRVKGAEAPSSRRPGWVTPAVALVGLAGLLAYLGLGGEQPLVAGVAVAVGTVLLERLVVVPALAFVRRFHAEAARLRAALACPFCRDAIAEDRAMGCDRPGCGALYHDACWAECRQDYGGCAIYGCASPSAHAVGRFALRRHVLRLVLATVFFPPRLVKALQESERATLRDAWRKAEEYQRGITFDDGRTLKFGALNLAICLPLVFLVIYLTVTGRLSSEVAPFVAFPIIALPILLVRLPLFAMFGWGVSRIVARVFKDELSVLRRADEGTFLARLAGGAGKKS